MFFFQWFLLFLISCYYIKSTILILLQMWNIFPKIIIHHPKLKHFTGICNVGRREEWCGFKNFNIS